MIEVRILVERIAESYFQATAFDENGQVTVVRKMKRELAVEAAKRKAAEALTEDCSFDVEDM